MENMGRRVLLGIKMGRSMTRDNFNSFRSFAELFDFQVLFYILTSYKCFYILKNKTTIKTLDINSAYQKNKPILVSPSKTRTPVGVSPKL